MIEVLIAAIPVVLAYAWRLSYDAGRRWGAATHILNIDGTAHALIVNRKALYDIEGLAPKLDRDGWQESGYLFDRHQQIYTPPRGVWDSVCF